MNWTGPTELRMQVQKLWDRGLLLASLADGEELFPRSLKLKGPSSRELGDHFPEVRRWIARLDDEAKFYRLVWRSVNHRILGTNQVPAEIWIDSLDNALGLIGKRRESDTFHKLVDMTRDRQPMLIAWLRKRPLRALELTDDWHLLLDIVAWLLQHPRSHLYLRQVDVPGVHSKFIEGHRAVLGELFELVLPPELIDATSSGQSGFCRRYGFRDKPVRVRFRILDPEIALLHTGAEEDITLPQETFARLNVPVAKVFITENEINFLAFPPVPGGIVIFGGGYGFENLAAADWLHKVALYYWGDIDTHGFAILNQLRSSFPQAVSFLMDRQTLLAHRTHWVVEPQPENCKLMQLNPPENMLCNDLRQNRWGDRVRLEQEKIGFHFLVNALKKLSQCDEDH
jgi:hypothetical protein